MDSQKHLQKLQKQVVAAAFEADTEQLEKAYGILTGKEKAKEPSRDPDARLVSQGLAAKKLNVSRTTIFRMLKDGELASVNTRGRRKVLLSSVYALITKHKNHEEA